MHECMYKSYETTLTHLCIFLNRPIVLYLLLFLTLWINRNRKKVKFVYLMGQGHSEVESTAVTQFVVPTEFVTFYKVDGLQ